MDWRELFRRHGQRLGLALGLLALGVVAQQAWAHRHLLNAQVWEVDSGLILLALSLGVAAQFAFGLAWHRLTRHAGMQTSLREDLQHWGISLLAKYLPGKIWQPLARTGLYGNSANAASVVGLYLREQILSLGVAMLIVAAAAPVALPPHMQNYARLLALAGGLLLLMIGNVRHLPHWLPHWLRRLNDVRGTDRRALIDATVLNAVAYGFLCAGFVALVRGLGLDAANVLTLSAGLCLAGLAGVAAFFIPAGLGVREAGLLWYLAPVLGTGPAAALAIAARAWLLLAECAVALWALAITHRQRSIGRRKGARAVSYPQAHRLQDASGRLLRARRIGHVLETLAGRPLRAARVLDLGASHLLMARAFATHGAAVVGMDVEHAALSRGMHERGAEAENLQAVVGSAMALPFANGAFDIVVCNHVYEHVPDPAVLMREIGRVLAKDGVCYFSGGHRYQLIEPHYRLPFLSWLPKRAADRCLQLAGLGAEYDIGFLTLPQLDGLLSGFHARDVTVETLRLERSLAPQPRFAGLLRRLPKSWVTWLARWSPTRIWLLTHAK